MNEYIWIDLSADLTKLSKSINNKSSIDEDIVDVFHHLFHIVNVYDLNVKRAWHKWIRKAISKEYQSEI